MTYPTQQEYERALRNPALSIRAPQLAGAQLVSAKNNGILRFSGGHFFVFVVDMGGRRIVVRCFSHPLPEAREQIPLIADYLARTGLPYFVRTEYVHDAIVVRDQILPLILMDYAHGVHLGKFVEENLGVPNVRQALAKAWSIMMKQLHEKKVAHGDLQQKNILAAWDGSSVALRLVDYETVVVPALDKEPLVGGGFSAFQHPNAHSLVERSFAIDHFPALVIATSLTALVEKPALWTELKADSDSGLLFQSSDFASPSSSLVFAALKTLRGTAAHLALTLERACLNKDPLALPPLHVVESQSTNVTPQKRWDSWVRNVKNGASQPTPTPPVVVASSPVNGHETPIRNINSVQVTPTPSPARAPAGNHQGTPKPPWMWENQARNQQSPVGGSHVVLVPTVAPPPQKPGFGGKNPHKPTAVQRPNAPMPARPPTPKSQEVIPVIPEPWTPPSGPVESPAPRSPMQTASATPHRTRVVVNPPLTNALAIRSTSEPPMIPMRVFIIMLVAMVIAILIAIFK